jgi:hypothetical protein
MNDTEASRRGSVRMPHGGPGSPAGRDAPADTGTKRRREQPLLRRRTLVDPEEDLLRLTEGALRRDPQWPFSASRPAYRAEMALQGLAVEMPAAGLVVRSLEVRVARICTADLAAV